MSSSLDHLLDRLAQEAAKPVVEHYVVDDRKPGRPGRVFNDAQLTVMIGQYRDGATLKELASQYRASDSVIRRVLVAAGVRIRPKGTGKHGRPNVYRARMRELLRVAEFLESRRAPRIRIAGQPAAAVVRTVYSEMARRAAA